MPTDYVLKISEPNARRVEVSLSTDTRGEPALDVRIPVWTPGSYLVREHQRHVDGLTARDQEGRPLFVQKIDKSTWRVECAGAREVRVDYRLHCFELTVRTNHVDPSHAFINPAAACAFVVGREHERCTLRLELPAGWRAFVPLEQRDGERGGVFQAADYDELADSPIEAGPPQSHQVAEFTAQGVLHRLVVWGRGDLDLQKLTADMTKIIDAEAAWFGGLPYQDPYLFLLHLSDKGRGGLEHRRSCALVAPRFSFTGKLAYEDFLQLVAHEFFHLWNVKRLRPAAFTPYDWTRENHTGLLWAMEGLTSTYEVMALRRAGLVTPQRFLELWAERLTSLLRTPGRLRTSLVQASYDAWIKHYRPDESSANTTVSYYLKGSVVGFLLDLELRRRTGGERSLDDLIRLLFQRHGEAPGLPEDGVEKAALELVPALERVSLQAWLDQALRQPVDLDLSGLAGVGLVAAVRPADGSDDKGRAVADAADLAAPGARAVLGASLRERAGLQEVTHVVEGGPAQQAGLLVGDELAALDGFRSEVRARLSRMLPGQVVRAAVFRMDELLELPVTMAAAPADTVTLHPTTAVSPQQRALREQWLGARWPEEPGAL